MSFLQCKKRPAHFRCWQWNGHNEDELCAQLTDPGSQRVQVSTAEIDGVTFTVLLLQYSVELPSQDGPIQEWETAASLQRDWWAVFGPYWGELPPAPTFDMGSPAATMTSYDFVLRYTAL